MQRSPRRRSFLALLATWPLFLGACSNPCDDLVDRRCDCGPELCRAAREELKLATELLRSLGGSGGNEVVAERCKERLATFACAPVLAAVPSPPAASKP